MMVVVVVGEVILVAAVSNPRVVMSSSAAPKSEVRSSMVKKSKEATMYSTHSFISLDALVLVASWF
jgi:hypothetical protein